MPRNRVEEEFIEEWDKKKIAIGIAVIMFLLAGGWLIKQYFFPRLILPALNNQKNQQSVAGANTDGNASFPAQHISLPNEQSVQTVISQLKNQVSNLSVNDIASSSPQVQQIIQELQKLPGDSAKSVCIQLCNRL